MKIVIYRLSKFIELHWFVKKQIKVIQTIYDKHTGLLSYSSISLLNLTLKLCNTIVVF